MSYKQIVTPNPNVPYYGGLCEGYVEGTIGVATPPKKQNDGTYMTYGVYRSASSAWSDNYKGGNHDALPPKGVRVALYFSLGSTTAGHVALQLEDGRVASSTMTGYHDTGYIHPNLLNLIDMYARSNNGCKYLGWSEYIGKVKVVEEDMATNVEEVLQSALNAERKNTEILQSALNAARGSVESAVKSNDILQSALNAARKEVEDLKKQLADKGNTNGYEAVEYTVYRKVN
jgi:hypothetical protein